MIRHTPTQQIATATRALACTLGLGMAMLVTMPRDASGQTVTPPEVPDDIRVDPPHVAFLIGRGVGTQNYVCLPSPSIGHVAWTLSTPQATLLDDQQAQLTTHFFSPNPDENGIVVRATWEDSVDTSMVWGRVVASSPDAAFVRADAIPWLKLEVVGKRTGPTGGTALTATTFIQRVNTVGGVAPAAGCTLPTDIGRKAFVPYEADYVFFRR